MSTTGPQFALNALQHANVTVNSSGIITAVQSTNPGTGWQSFPSLGPIGVIGHQGNQGTPGMMGNQTFAGFSQPHTIVPPDKHHWSIEHILPHMIWSKFYYQKECWRLWHWLSYSDGREDDGMHDVYNKTHRDFPTELEAKSVMVLEQFEV